MKSSITLLCLLSILLNGLIAQTSDPDQPIFSADFLQIEQSDDLVLPIPADEIMGYSIFVNEELYRNEIQPVMPRAIVGYSLGEAGTGTFFVHRFVISEGVSISGKFDSPRAFYQELLRQDPAGEWRYDPATLTIYGGQQDTAYGSLELTSADSEGKTLAFAPRKGSLAMAMRIKLPTGEHKVDVVRKATAYKASARVRVGQGQPVSSKL